MFDKKWFAKYQKLLLRFANSWMGKKILRVDGEKSFVGKNKILKILPNAIFWKEGKKYKAEFRTHDKFGKRLYYAFYPIWKLFHLWDMVLYPRLNLGFDSLTKYPDAGTGATTVDGYTNVNNATYSTARNAATGGFDATSANQQLGRNSSGYDISRFICTLDTSALTSAANISSAILSFFGTNLAFANADTDTQVIVSANPASNNDIVAADYAIANFGSTSFGSIAFASWNQAAYNDITLNGDGIGAISKTSITKFGARTLNEINNTQPTGNNIMTAYMADQTGTTNDPKLVVTYTMSTGNILAFI